MYFSTGIGERGLSNCATSSIKGYVLPIFKTPTGRFRIARFEDMGTR